MKGTRAPVTIALLSLALLVLAFAGTIFLTAPVGIIFQGAIGFSTANTIAQIGALLTAVCLIFAAAWVAIPTALEPAGWVGKCIKVLPIYLLGFTLAAMIANQIGLATLGSIVSPTSPVKVSLAVAWLGASAVLATVALVITAARANLSDRIRRTVTVTSRIALVPGLILAIAMMVSVGIVMTGQTGPSPAGGPPAPPSPGASGGLGDPVTQFEIGGALMLVLALIGVVSTVIGMRTRAPASAVVSTGAAPGMRIDYRREVTRALVAAGVISAIAFVAIQVVPVSRENPPVLSTVQWDSPQTKDLVTRTCMNCHSNETPWPWYASFAPGSWLTSVHVTSARQQFNLSELNKLSASRKTRLARDMADAIRNGVMPPVDFLFMHPEARLTAAEKDQLIQGLANSIK